MQSNGVSIKMESIVSWKARTVCLFVCNKPRVIFDKILQTGYNRSTKECVNQVRKFQHKATNN